MRIDKSYYKSRQSLLGLKKDLYNFDWSRIKKIDKNELEKGIIRALKSPYLYGALGLVIGLVCTMQFRTEAKRPLSPVLFYNQLVDLKKDATQVKNDLLAGIRKNQKELSQKEAALSEKDAATKKMFAELEEQQLIAGETPVTGSGIVITLSDGEAQIKDEEEKSLAHAADLRDIVNLLWYAGAEAVSINDERIISSSSIDCIVSTILINTNNYAPPFTVKAIGSKNDLYDLMNNSRKLINIKKRADKKQVSLSMKTQDNIRIEEYRDF